MAHSVALMMVIGAVTAIVLARRRVRFALQIIGCFIAIEVAGAATNHAARRFEHWVLQLEDTIETTARALGRLQRLAADNACPIGSCISHPMPPPPTGRRHRLARSAGQ